MADIRDVLKRLNTQEPEELSVLDKFYSDENKNPVQNLFDYFQSKEYLQGAATKMDQLNTAVEQGDIGPAAIGSVGKKIIPKVAKLTSVVDDLPMDQASRMARAEEMGFDTSQKYYHGMPTPMVGESFKQKPAGTFFTKDPRFTDEFSKSNIVGYEGGSNVIPTHLSTKKTFDPESPAQLEWLKQKALPKIEQDTREHFIKMNKEFPDSGMWTPERAELEIKKIVKNLGEGNWHAMEQDAVVKTLKDAGLDSYYVNEGGTKNIAVLDPTKIRSINAKFDPKQKSSKNILASGAGATIGFKQLMDYLNKKEDNGL